MTASDRMKYGGGGKIIGNMELLILGKIETPQSDINNSWQHYWLFSARGTSGRGGEAAAPQQELQNFGGSREGT